MNSTKVTGDRFSKKTELLNRGLAVQQENIQESSSHHQSTVKLSWVHQDLAHLRPFIRSTIKLFKLGEKASNPEILVQEVLAWTSAQPFLTQKVCQLLCNYENYITAGEEAAVVEQLIQNHLIANWETQIAAEHLQTIHDGLVFNLRCDSIWLLRLYQQLLQEGELLVHDNLVQTELLNLGLVVKQENKLRISNRIYLSIFNLNWVDQELGRLRPMIHNTTKLFKLDKKATHPDLVLEQVLFWTSAQSFLTQKVCQLLCDYENFIAVGREAAVVEQLVQTHLIANWEIQIAAEHLQAIQQNLVKNQFCNPVQLLRLYQQILQQRELPPQDNPVETELLNIGLIVKQDNKLKVANRIYQSVFNLDWINQELEQLQPLIQNTIKIFNLNEKSSNPEILVQEVLMWTASQPFLTKNVCQLLCEHTTLITAGEEAFTVQQLVQTRLITNWKTQIAAEHLQIIYDDLVSNQRCNPIWLLRLYQQILQEGELPPQDNPVETELLNIGLVVKQNNKLKVANRIYQSVFNLSWVDQQLANMLEVPSAINSNITSKKFFPAFAMLEARNLISNPRSIILKVIWVLLAIAGFSALSFNIYKNIEINIIFQEGNELFNQGEYKKAIAKYDKLLNIDSNYYQAWTNRGYALAGLQEYNKMLESCSTATIIEPKAIYAWNCQGEALYNLQQYYEAISAFDSALTLDTKDPVFWINKTESLLALKQFDTALITIDEAIHLLQEKQKLNSQENIARELAIAFSHKGKVLWQKKQYGEALAAFDQALINDPKYFTALRGRGLAFQGLKQYKQAIAQFQEMLTLSRLTDAQKAESLYYLGITYCQSSQADEGLAALEAALKLKPDYQAAEQAKSSCTR
ncbi:MAG: tetratricopeptide repeat protein [Pelatocladus maniniholoensis HA4357-MV3]|uniref:Tetratricopeptide repeat protein n=1 Tax=Pelatocladus maniniholoensis HA4357-MV3 TaxID=1117104 RepID=A0A9E3HCX3_9NOST|nr:tetratricopeptide repeat protein [Pelatocladus maniniholoensis HA4357-MV3]